MEAMEAFLAYAGRYDTDNAKIHLKIVHTQAVDAVMERLSDSLGLDTRMRELAHLCAVYHDIGRFEQLKRYDTFLDHLSVDHAQLGCEVLYSGGFLDGLPEKDRQMVLTAVANHNRLAVEDGMDEETLLLCRMIRDADKCDIFRVFATEDPKATTGVSEKEAAKEKISDAVYESLMSRRCVRKEDRISGLDIWVSFFGFLYDLNFPESLRIVRENAYYKKRFKALEIKDDKTRLQVEKIIAEAEKYMDEMEWDWRKNG